MQNSKMLTVIDGETLMDKRLPPTKFLVDTLLPQGLCILGGSPKVGKSWLVLDLCTRIAKGEPMWKLPTHQGEVLYLCLEDSERRIQERLNTITDDVPPGSTLLRAVPPSRAASAIGSAVSSVSIPESPMSPSTPFSLSAPPPPTYPTVRITPNFVCSNRLRTSLVSAFCSFTICGR